MAFGSGVIQTANAAPVEKPGPFGAVPSARQLKWHEMELYAFLHFTVNTFTDREWGYGDEDPSIFNPTAFDADAIVSALKTGGMRGVILTCKHHDGFCLWPTKATDHNISHSSWRGGKGDVVREISEAARRQGLKFGVYVSPWDRNSAFYGTPEYIRVYRQQITELLTNYGPIFEVWFDGANGGDGYYGGAKEKRLIDKIHYYQWPQTWDLVRSLQPDAVIFSDVGPDLRWVGNEKGYAQDTCWETYDPKGPDGGPGAPGYTHDVDGGTGTWNGSHWMPPECDVSIRPGWFWHEKENSRVKTPRDLMDLYFRSTGRGGSLLLNVPPDRRGLLSEPDVRSLAEFGRALKETFGEDLARGATAKASSVRGNAREYAGRNAIDGDARSYWMPQDGAANPELILSFPREKTFNVIRLREHIPLGQRIQAVEVEAKRGGSWISVAKATSIGACRLIRAEQPVTTNEVKLRVAQSAAAPAVQELGLFLET